MFLFKMVEGRKGVGERVRVNVGVSTGVRYDVWGVWGGSLGDGLSGVYGVGHWGMDWGDIFCPILSRILADRYCHSKRVNIKDFKIPSGILNTAMVKRTI